MILEFLALRGIDSGASGWEVSKVSCLGDMRFVELNGEFVIEMNVCGKILGGEVEEVGVVSRSLFCKEKIF